MDKLIEFIYYFTYIFMLHNTTTDLYDPVCAIQSLKVSSILSV